MSRTPADGLLKDHARWNRTSFSSGGNAATSPGAEIRLNRPDKGNALTMAMLDRLGDIVDEIARDRDTRAVVVRATGRFFCTGGDIEAWGRLSPHDMGRDWILRGIDVFERLAALPQPVIAALTGHALGGGLELAMAADLRIAVKAARLGCPEATLGMVPGWMGTRRLAELIGPARARHLLLLATPDSRRPGVRVGTRDRPGRGRGRPATPSSTPGSTACWPTGRRPWR